MSNNHKPRRSAIPAGQVGALHPVELTGESVPAATPWPQVETLGFLFPLPDLSESRCGPAVAAFEYREREGDGRFLKVRFEPGTERNGKPRESKAVRWYHRSGDAWKRGRSAGGHPPALKLWRFDEAIEELGEDGTLYLAEGEKAAWSLIARGLPATTAPGGAGEWSDEHTDAIAAAGVKRVVILQDNDNPGKRDSAKKLASLANAGIEACIVDFASTDPDFPDKGDAWDFFARGGTLTALQALIADAFKAQAPVSEPALPDPIKRSTRLILTAAAEIKREPVPWLWPEWIPRRAITVCAGRGGSGKSTLALDLAARLSTGRDWPDGTKNEEPPSNNLLFAGEDDPSSVTCIRLEKAGANMARVKVCEGCEVPTADGKSRRIAFNLSMIGSLEDALRALPDCRLIIIDPISSCLGISSDWNAVELRSVLDPLARLAREFDLAVLLIHHLNKGTEGPARKKVQGSAAYADTARSLLMVREGSILAGTGEAEPSQLIVEKSNVARTGRALRFFTREHRTEWADDGKTHWVNPDDSFAPDSPDARGSLADAKHFLQVELANGPIPINTLLNSGQQAGLSKRTLERAKTELGVKSGKNGMDGGWAWSLPESPEGTTP